MASLLPRLPLCVTASVFFFDIQVFQDVTKVLNIIRTIKHFVLTP